MMVGLKKDISNQEHFNLIKRFIKNFAVLFSCRSLGIFICLFTTILLGRILSVKDMGAFNLVIVSSNIIVIPMVFGVNTGLLKIIPETPSLSHDKILGSVALCNTVLCTITSCLCLCITPLICHLIKISYTSWYLSIILAIICAWCIIVETFLKTQESFFCIGLAKMIGSVVLLAGYMATIFLLNKSNIYTFLLFNLLSQLVILFITFLKINHGHLHFDQALSLKIYKLSFFYMLSWLLATSLYSIDVYILAFFSPGYDVGIYSVYQVNIRNYFSTFYNDIFAAVFLPTLLNNNVSMKDLYKKLLKWLPLIFIILCMGTAVVCTLLILAYGHQYPIVPLYITLVSLGIGFQGIFFLFNSLLVLNGLEGAKLSFKLLLEPFIVLLLIIIVFTYLWGSLGTFISFAVNQCILMLFLLYKLNKIIKA